MMSMPPSWARTASAIAAHPSGCRDIGSHEETGALVGSGPGARSGQHGRVHRA
jgi:hypothetical protein